MKQTPCTDNLEQDRLYAFRRIYETNISLLTRFARRFTSTGIAEDIVQDVFVELWKNEKELHEATSRAYLFAAVRNRCINCLKQEQTKDLHTQQMLVDARLRGLDYFDSAEKLLIDTEQLQQVYTEIDRLPDRCRHIFKLAYFDDKKSWEIADLLKLSVRTVEHHLYLGLKTLRSRLTERG